jgi:CDP-glycerol glycerophosphotransferase (TagB/SpsB family)
MESAVMITDYSSVAMDFAYMRRPIIFYQFDKERFREAQYAEGYFSYSESGFGDVTETAAETVNSLKKIFENNLKLPEATLNAFEEFYPLYDDKNNERIFEAINALK